MTQSLKCSLSLALIVLAAACSTDKAAAPTPVVPAVTTIRVTFADSIIVSGHTLQATAVVLDQSVSSLDYNQTVQLTAPRKAPH